MKKNILLFTLVLVFQFLFAQFPPPAGQPGSTAIDKNDPSIKAWATGCSIDRGWVNIADTFMGKTTVGNSASAIGEALSDGVVSLGDGGEATCSFTSGILNGPGFDFAVFENSFTDSFLELAFVEVTSDGARYVRFPAVSNTQDTIQIDTFGSIDARMINNLAGKYRAGFGTPFDLEELKDSAGLDVNNIMYVRVVDVVGNIDSVYATKDQSGHKVNDPWPTPFPSAGFDLDAIAVMHPKFGTGTADLNADLRTWKVVPALFDEFIFIQSDDSDFQLVSMEGRLIADLHANEMVNTSALSSGFYLIKSLHDNSFQKLIKP